MRGGSVRVGGCGVRQTMYKSQVAIKVRISNKGAGKKSFLGILFARSVNIYKIMPQSIFEHMTLYLNIKINVRLMTMI